MRKSPLVVKAIRPSRLEARRRPSSAEVAMRAPESHAYRLMLAVLTQFRVVIANLKKHYVDIEQHTGVSGTQLWALIAISQQPGITVGMLARELAIHQSTASNMLDKLAELGHITRAREGIDQRVVSIYLTGQGKKTVRQAPAPAMGLLQNALLSLPHERVEGLSEHLDELINAIGLKRKTGEGTPLSLLLQDDKPTRAQAAKKKA
ncbi:MAG: MarR family transcriptional regulator [Betaproteobacteria bacterium]